MFKTLTNTFPKEEESKPTPKKFSFQLLMKIITFPRTSTSVWKLLDKTPLDRKVAKLSMKLKSTQSRIMYPYYISNVIYLNFKTYFIVF